MYEDEKVILGNLQFVWHNDAVFDRYKLVQVLRSTNHVCSKMHAFIRLHARPPGERHFIDGTQTIV